MCKKWPSGKKKQKFCYIILKIKKKKCTIHHILHDNDVRSYWFVLPSEVKEDST